MRKIWLHLTDYDRLGENSKMTTRTVSLPDLPQDKQYLLVAEGRRTRCYFVTNSYVPVELGDELMPHVFATKTSAPYQEAVRVGISGDDLTTPSLTEFEGQLSRI